MKYEYMIIDDMIGGNLDCQEELNYLGEDGWELCAIVHNTFVGNIGNNRYYFKRKIEVTE